MAHKFKINKIKPCFQYYHTMGGYKWHSMVIL